MKAIEDISRLYFFYEKIEIFRSGMVIGELNQTAGGEGTNLFE
jgi:hypothetical protein